MTRRSLYIFYALFAMCLVITGPYLLALAIGAMFGYLSEIPFSKLCQKFKITRPNTIWFTAFFTATVFVVLFLVPVVYGIVSGVLQIADLLIGHREQLTKQIPQIDSSAVAIDHWLERFHIPIRFSEIVNRGSQILGSTAQLAAKTVGNAIQATPGALFQLMLALFAWVVFLVEGKKYRENILPLLIPWQPERDLICETTADVLRGVVVASAMVSLVQTIMVTVFLLISGTPNSFLLGLLAFFASFVPVVGTAPILFGAAIFKYFDGSTGWAIFLALSVIGVGTIDNVLRPYFFKGSVDLSFFWITTAFLGGLATAGLAGAVLGPLLFSLFHVFYKRTFQGLTQKIG